MTCNCCEITDQAFGADSAKADIEAYRRKGPAAQTRLIVDAVRSLDLTDAELLDIGGGVGVLYHELLQDVARRATHVDASSAYLEQARQEAARRGHADRVQFIHADFTAIASSLPQADIVTLDRVVCCYPDFQRLLGAAAAHGRRALAMTYPRQVWYMRFGLGIINLFQRLRGDPFRVFLHPIRDMDDVLRRAGFERATLRRLLVWEMALYRRI